MATSLFNLCVVCGVEDVCAPGSDACAYCCPIYKRDAELIASRHCPECERPFNDPTASTECGWHDAVPRARLLKEFRAALRDQHQKGIPLR